MKKMFVLSCMMVVAIISANAQNNTTAEKSTRSNYLTEEPTYQLDRRLQKAQPITTDNSGALGAGCGGSYASNSYRSSAYKKAATQQKTEEKNKSNVAMKK